MLDTSAALADYIPIEPGEDATDPTVYRRTLDGVRELTDDQRFDAAEKLVGHFLERLPPHFHPRDKSWLRRLRKFLNGLELWDRFDYRAAAELVVFKPEENPALADYAPAHKLAALGSRIADWLELLAPGVKSPYLAYDFLAAALRQARRGEYNDGLIRLYRALEARAQAEACHVFGVDSTAGFPTDRIPPETRFFSGYRLYRHGKAMDLGMEATYAILYARNNRWGRRFKKFHQLPPEAGLDLQTLQRMRNRSPLAHGSQVISEQTFFDGYRLIEEFLEVKRRASEELPPLVEIDFQLYEE